MRFRSLLFVPGDSPRKFERASSCGADGLILDLEDAVVIARKVEARELVSSLLIPDEARPWSFLVRVNALDTGLTAADVDAVVRPGLSGILLPKANGAEDVAELAAMIAGTEEARGMEPGSVGIAVVATETPRAMFNLGSYASPHPRLFAMTWGAEDLAAAVGAEANREAGGAWTAPYVQARSMCLFAAAAAGVAALDTLYADYRDPTGLAADCARSRRDGFVGRVAIHPDQIGVINDGYTPSSVAIDKARSIVAAFEAEPNAGAVGIDGEMYDIPHLKAARRTLALAGHAPEAQ